LGAVNLICSNFPDKGVVLVSVVASKQDIGTFIFEKGTLAINSVSCNVPQVTPAPKIPSNAPLSIVASRWMRRAAMIFQMLLYKIEHYTFVARMADHDNVLSESPEKPHER
jgi:hypothetical protein